MILDDAGRSNSCCSCRQISRIYPILRSCMDIPFCILYYPLILLVLIPFLQVPACVKRKTSSISSKKASAQDTFSAEERVSIEFFSFFFFFLYLFIFGHQSSLGEIILLRLSANDMPPIHRQVFWVCMILL